MEFENAQAYTAQASSSDGMRRRPVHSDSYTNQPSPSTNNKYSNKSLKRRVVKTIDLFPKIETDLCEDKTDQGARLLLLGILLATTLILAECYAWHSTNSTTIQTVVVDTSLNKKMRVDLNISFPALHCDDLHLDLMDVAGDVQMDVTDTMTKRRLHKSDGSFLTKEEVTVQMNRAHAKEVAAKEAISTSLAKDYCGPCYGAGKEEGQCCNFCDDVMDAYKKANWHVEQVRSVAEQCIREHKTGAKKMSKGEGCQIAGFMTFNRLNGNFHIAMGEGVERNGHHIHTFLPDDMLNFNASHVIHELRFGEVFDSGTTLGEMNALNGVQKIVKKSDGSTGTFQYYIKIVPTTYKGKDLVNSLLTKKKNDLAYLALKAGDADSEPILETNRYFTTERFVPLMAEDVFTDEHYDLGDLVRNHDKDEAKDEYDDDGSFDDQGSFDDDNRPAVGVKVGGNTGSTHTHHHNHRSKQQILPGVFFIYQIYPFAVEVSRDRVPVMHLLIRIMATLGGLFTIVGWFDAFLCSRKKRSFR